MDLSGKRVSGEGSNNYGADANNLQLVPYSESSPNKKVCRYCKREFRCGRGLGGHIKVHFKRRKMTKYSRVKVNNRRGFGSSAVAPHRRNNNNNNEVSGGAEIIDLSRSLIGSSWKLHKRRGSNVAPPTTEERNKRPIREPDSDEDDYVSCDSEDSCDEDDYDNIRLRNRLRRLGFYGNGHKICWTKRVFMCTVCNLYFNTYYALFRHLREYKLTENGLEEGRNGNEAQGEEAGEVVNEAAAAAAAAAENCSEVAGKKERGKEDAVMRDCENEGSGGVGEGMKEKGSNEVNAEVGEKSGGGGGSKDQQVSTSVAVAPPKMLGFDLNELPPMED